MTWPTARLSELAVSANAGFACGESDPEGIAQIRMNNVGLDGTINFDKVRRVPRTAAPIERYLLQQDDVLFNATNSPELVGKTALTGGLPEPFVYSNHFIRIRTDQSKLHPNYLAKWLTAQQKAGRFELMCNKWVNQASVRREDLLSLDIPLPPLPEQRRIAAILDKADALRAMRHEAIAKLDQLLQSVFLDMFGDPVTNPKGWPTHRFGDVTESRLGKMLDKRTSQGPHLKPYLANANVQWGRFELDSLRTMNFDPEDQLEFSLKTGDLLICEGGEPGRCAIWKEELQDCYYQKALHRVRCNPSYCVPEYLQWLFWFLSGSAVFDASITTATIAHLPGIKLKALRIPLPPVALQKSFATILDSVEKTADQHSTSQRGVESLFLSLQQQAFEGTAAV